jgi:hypothetical protein
MRSTSVSRLRACQQINFKEWFNRPSHVVGAPWTEPKRPPLLSNFIGSIGSVKITVTGSFFSDDFPTARSVNDSAMKAIRAAFSSRNAL